MWGSGTSLRAPIALTLLFFACTLVVFSVAGLLRGDLGPADFFAVGVPMILVDGLIAFQLVFVLRRAERLPAVQRWALLIIGVLIVAVLQSAWDTQLRIWAGTVWAQYGTPWLAFVRSLTINTYNTGMYIALIAFEASNRDLRQKQRELIASRAAERDANLTALRYQLNPHFLFNTLNAISSLVVIGRNEEAESMLDRLSSFLRASLTADPRTLVHLDEELEMLETYLEIEGVRFQDRLVTAVDLPPRLGSARVPPFLLQPIVENAIKYAVAPASRPVHVRIAAEERAGMLQIAVEDDGDGCGDVASGTGVGLANIRERLRLNYGDAARLDMDRDGTGCRVRIVMPLDRAEPAETRLAAVA